METNNIPPNKPEDERSVLACLLFDNDNIKSEVLQEEHFYNSKNREIYKRIKSLSFKVEVTLNILLSAFKSEPGMLEYILSLDLDDCVPTDKNFPFHVSQIKSCALRRKQIELAVKILNEARNEKVDSAASIEELKQYLDRSKVNDCTSIIEPHTLSDKVDHLYKHGLQRGALTGWNKLDGYYTVRPGEITLITGIPSHGKSTVCTNLITNIANKYDWKFAVFSPENYPLQRYVAHIAQIYTDKGFGMRIEEAHRMTEGAKDYAKEWINSHFVFITPHDEELQFDNIIRKAVICVLKYGIRGLVIDPWNEVDHTRPYGLSETEYVSKCLSKLRYFAHTYNVHVWLIAHPTKLIRRQDGTYPIPTPYDVAGSAHFRNKADCCLTVWRNDAPENKDTKVKIYIQKIRFHEIGRTGEVELEYDKITQSYKDVKKNID